MTNQTIDIHDVETGKRITAEELGITNAEYDAAIETLLSLPFEQWVHFRCRGRRVFAA